MPKVFLKGHIIVPNSELEMIEPKLIEHIELSQQETGCLIFEILQNKVNLNKFEVYEVFTDQYSFAAHQHRVKQSEWGKIIEHIETYYQVSKHTQSINNNKFFI